MLRLRIEHDLDDLVSRVVKHGSGSRVDFHRPQINRAGVS